MHDTLQLQEACRKDPTISSIFQGVFAADQIPWRKLNSLHNWSIIMNTDPISKPGQHWVTAMKRDGRCYFFDSYGNSPLTYNARLWQALAKCLTNKKDYQQTRSTVCGDYCLFFLKLFSKADFPADFKMIDKYLDEDDDEENDKFLHALVHSWFPKILNNVSHNEDLRSSQTRGNRSSCFTNQIRVARLLS